MTLLKTKKMKDKNFKTAVGLITYVAGIILTALWIALF